RNGGVVGSKFRVSFPAIAAAHGKPMARRMHTIAHEAVDMVEALVGRFGLADARFTRSGQVKAAHNRAALAHAAAEAEWLRAELGDTTTSVLSAEEVAAETGSTGFVGGVLHAGSGGL